MKVYANRSPVDTTYGKLGRIKQIKFFKIIEVDSITKSVLGNSSPSRRLDSIRWHNDYGEYTRTQHYEKGNNISRSTVPRRVSPEELAARAWQGSMEPDYVEGRAGMRVERRVLLPMGHVFADARRLDKSPEIELKGMMHEGPLEGFYAKVRIAPGSTNCKLRLDLGEKEAWEKLYTIRGYHLNETDFKRRDRLTDEQTWRAEGQEFLYLRLRSTEKLMHIYRNGEQYTVLPVGRQLDEVRVGGLPTGKYLLEIIDLRTQEKRYYWVVKG